MSGATRAIRPLWRGPVVRRRGRTSMFPRSVTFILALGVICMLGVAAIVSAFWTPHPPTAVATGAFFDPPSWAHLFGTDAVGADVF